MRSWVESANRADCDFPLENLPYGVFSPPAGGAARCGVAIGDRILDVAALECLGVIALSCGPVLEGGAWNALMAAGPAVWAELRARLTRLLAVDSAEIETVSPHLHPRTGARLHLPFTIAEFTDFYASRDHAFNVGSMFRGPEKALPPNWLHMPIGYNGRASSVQVSGGDVVRPWGQIRPEGAAAPIFAPSARLDFELELGAIVGQPSGGPISVAQADAMIFGYVLLNDWSARDIQAWEYQPLGPFQSKATATTISPWIVPAAALAPFRCAPPARENPLLPYLAEPGPMLYDIALEVGLTPRGGQETVITRTNFRHMYYAPAQQLAHHTVSGCPMRIGDLLGSGTVSGPAPENRGCLLERSWGGTGPISLAGGGQRSFLEDGDLVVMRGHAQGAGHRIGFGECAGLVCPAPPLPGWARG